MKKNDTVYVRATVDATRKVMNTQQVRVKIGDVIVWVSAEDIKESDSKEDEDQCC